MTRREGGFLADWPVEVCGTSARKRLRGHILQRSAQRLARTGDYAASCGGVSRTRSTHASPGKSAEKPPSYGPDTFHRFDDLSPMPVWCASGSRQGRRDGNRQRTEDGRKVSALTLAALNTAYPSDPVSPMALAEMKREDGSGFLEVLDLDRGVNLDAVGVFTCNK
jgi:hypothetical protein